MKISRNDTKKSRKKTKKPYKKVLNKVKICTHWPLHHNSRAYPGIQVEIALENWRSALKNPRGCCLIGGC